MQSLEASRRRDLEEVAGGPELLGQEREQVQRLVRLAVVLVVGALPSGVLVQARRADPVGRLLINESGSSKSEDLIRRRN